MSRHSLYILSIGLLFLQVSCRHDATVAFAPVAVAGEALADTASVWYKMLEGIRPSGKDGAIAIFGEFDETAVLSETLLASDMFDNIDGKRMPDGLPDFAGETLMPVFDVANGPYAGYFENMNEDFIREAALKGFLLATSCHCSSSIFDSSFSAQKPGTKLFIFSSSVLAGYGCPDVRYLVSASGLDTGVMSTVESSVSALFENAEQPSNIGVWASRDIISSGVYGNVFKEIRDRHTDKHSEAYLPWAGAAEIVCLSPDYGGTAEESVRNFFESYSAAEYDTPLSGVIVDDLACRGAVDSLNIAAEKLRNSILPEAEACKRLMAPGFRFVSPAETVAADCYEWLRRHDRFTHIVAWPDAAGYMTAVSSGVSPANIDADGMFTDEYKYNRAQNSDLETFRVIPVSQGCLTPEIAERMKRLAPLTYNKLIYVY